MTEQEHMALHADHRNRIVKLESNMVVLAQNTERITNAHEKLLRDHAKVLRQLAGTVHQTQESVQGLGRFAETFTPRVNTQPGGSRSLVTAFRPRSGGHGPNIHEEDAEVQDD